MTEFSDEIVSGPMKPALLNACRYACQSFRSRTLGCASFSRVNWASRSSGRN